VEISFQRAATLSSRSLLRALVLFTLASSAWAQRAQPQTNAEIKQEIIRESIASYPGNCPCPYNTARNGSRCGKRSAYSKPGGRSPVCYPEDVSEEMVQMYRKRHR
jgi:hypothetical protein